MRTPWLPLLLLLAACSDGIDGDGDGVGAKEDCNDDDPTVYPGAVEICDDKDNDCDGLPDDRDTDTEAPLVFTDADGDGFGGASLGRLCDGPAGSVAVGGDCDDARFDVNPDAPEVCNGIDDDCDQDVDDADTSLDTSTQRMFFADVDGDGYGSAVSFERACSAPAGYVEDATDCDDSPEGADRHPGAAEICDGKDNDCDLVDGLLVDDDDPDVDYTGQPILYEDDDGDGFGDPASAFQACEPPASAVDNGDDCDDRDRNNRPGGVEVCDGRDNDCDGLADDADWWDDAWPYRVTVTVNAPSRRVTAMPVAVDVDFANALLQVGDSSGLAADSVRVVLQDCRLDNPVLGAEFLDGISGVFDKRDPVDPIGDERGALVFLYDEDGDYATPEALPASGAVTIGVYFGSNATSAGVPAVVPTTALAATVSAAPVSATLGNGVSEATFDGARGGLVDGFGLVGGDSVGAQVDSEFGNGMYLAELGGGGAGAGWVSARDDDAATLSIVHESAMLAIVRAEGEVSNPYGGFAYTYDYFQFAHRPELYAKVTYELSTSSQVGPQGTQWGAAVRPWQIDNLALIGSGGGAANEDPGFVWAYGTYANDTYGVYLAYRVSPLQRNNPVTTTNGRFLGLAGQDQVVNPTVDQVTLPAGTRVIDRSVVVVYPYEGARVSREQDILGTITGVTTVVGTAERR